MSDPDELHRYADDEEWPQTFQTFARRIREENADLLRQLGERGPRLLRFSPDFSEMDGTHAFIQWKGTDVCLDFRCECGAQGHFDGDFAYTLRCGSCGRYWDMPHTVALVPTERGRSDLAKLVETDDDDVIDP